MEEQRKGKKSKDLKEKKTRKTSHKRKIEIYKGRKYLKRCEEKIKEKERKRDRE